MYESVYVHMGVYVHMHVYVCAHVYIDGCFYVCAGALKNQERENDHRPKDIQSECWETNPGSM